jgi:hypothetical protein
MQVIVLMFVCKRKSAVFVYAIVYTVRHYQSFAVLNTDEFFWTFLDKARQRYKLNLYDNRTDISVVSHTNPICLHIQSWGRGRGEKTIVESIR